MKKLLYMVSLLIVGFSVALMGVSSPTHATTPTISGFSGTIATGQTITISGTTMMDENKTGWLPMFQSGSAYGFEDVLSQTSGAGSVGAWDYSCGDGYCSFDPNVKLSGSKSARFHIAGAYVDHDNPSTILYFSPTSNPLQYWQRGYMRYDGVGWPTEWFKMWWLGGSGAYKVIQPNTGSSPTGWVYGTSNGYDNLVLPPSGNIQRGRWYCVELGLQISGGHVVMNAWVDGSISASSPVIDPANSIGPNGWQEIGIINLSGTNSSFSVDHYEDNYTVSTSGRIYCSSIIEIGNSSNYDTAMKRYQEPVYLSDTSVQVKVDLTGLGSGPYYLWVTNNRQERSAAYALSGGGGGDTTPPSVLITAPSQGQTVSGTVTISANASDNVAVGGVQFKIDASNYGTEDTTNAYAISCDTTTLSNGVHAIMAVARDTSGNLTTSNPISVTVNNNIVIPPATVLFEEDFEDTNFPSRGWYDGTYNNDAITASQHYTGSHAYKCRFTSGATKCAGGDPRRMLFTATDSVYISYWIKLSSNWQGSGKAYHPHMMYLLTDLNDAYDGFYGTYTTAYVEMNGLHPRMGLQDAANIDNTRIGVNLCSVTENRATHGCNGICDSHPWDVLDCYDGGGGVHFNGRMTTPSFTVTPNTWQFVEAYFKMNSVSGGKGLNDGIMRMWVNGNLLIDYTDIIYRTNQHPTMKFNQFALSPYIADGSPVDQYFWIDDLTVATSRPGIPPSPPLSLRVQ